MISIVIPTYNSAKIIDITISSVLSQSNPNWNLVVIDDGSTDNTKEVVSSYTKDPRIEYFFQSNCGVSAARNLGIEKARGDYVIFLDSDDYFEEDLVQRLHDEIYQNFDFITWNVLKIKNNIETVVKPENLGPLYNNNKLLFLAGSICIKKLLLIEVGAYDTNLKFGENYELGLRLCNSIDAHIKYIPKVLAGFYEADNRTSNSLKNQLDSNLYQYNKHKIIFDKFSNTKYFILYRIAFLYHKLGEYNNAQTFYISAIKSNPLKIKSWIRLIQIKLIVN